MSVPSAEDPVDVVSRRHVNWPTVALLAAVLAVADGFMLTSLQGAIGAVERTRGPFSSWMRISALLLPVFVVAVWKALTAAHRRYGPDLSRPRTVVPAALLVAAVGTVVGAGAVAASSAYDYDLQVKQLQVMHATHGLRVDHAQGHGAATGSGGVPASGGVTLPGGVPGPGQDQLSTLAVHVRGVGYATGVLLLTNLLLVGWVVALRGGRLGAGVRPVRVGVWTAAPAERTIGS